MTQGHDYLTLHRMALEDGYRGQGLGKIFFQKAEEICKDRKIRSIRVDTFEQNKNMQKLILKNGYTQCGFIFQPGGERCCAYEKLML